MTAPPCNKNRVGFLSKQKPVSNRQNMTPTPEDIALSDEICDQAVEHGYYHDIARELIAAHCAPLRELAEIGRLAVEEEKFRCALKAKYMAAGGKTDDCMGLYDDFYEASITHREAVCAYLAKQKEPPQK